MPPPKQSHCGKGHPLEGFNAIVHEFGGRECRICKYERAKRAYRAKVEREKVEELV